jgi:hypothetical protein
MDTPFNAHTAAELILSTTLTALLKGRNANIKAGNILLAKAHADENTIVITELDGFTDQLRAEFPALLRRYPVDGFRTDVGVWVITPVPHLTPNESVAFHLELFEAWSYANGSEMPSNFAMDQMRQFGMLAHHCPEVLRKFNALTEADKFNQLNGLKLALQTLCNGSAA